MLIDKWLFGTLREKAGEAEGAGGSEESEESEEGSEGSEEGTEEESEEGEEGDKIKEGELTAEQVTEAHNLYKLLTNPNSQKSTLEYLAREAGIQIGEGKAPETKAEAKEAAKKTQEILEEALGVDLKWLAPKLAIAFDKLLEQSEGKTKEQLDKLAEKQVVKEVDQAYEKLARDTKGESRKFESRMVGLADKLFPAPGMSTEEYIRHLYTIASASGEGKSAKLRLAEKINKNSKDVPGRIAESAASGGGKNTDKNARLSIKDAVRVAAEKQGYTGT